MLYKCEFFAIYIIYVTSILYEKLVTKMNVMQIGVYGVSAGSILVIQKNCLMYQFNNFIRRTKKFIN